LRALELPDVALQRHDLLSQRVDILAESYRTRHPEDHRGNDPQQ
jgi:hypothetical protein